MIKIIFYNESDHIRYEKSVSEDSSWLEILEHAVFPGLNALTYNPGNVDKLLTAIDDAHRAELYEDAKARL